MERGDLDVDRVPDFTVGMVSGATGQVIWRNFSLNSHSLMLNKEDSFPFWQTASEIRGVSIKIEQGITCLIMLL